MDEERKEKIKEMMEKLETRLNRKQKEELIKGITEEEVKSALKGAQNRKGPRKSGITYEFWKLWLPKKKKKKKGGEKEKEGERENQNQREENKMEIKGKHMQNASNSVPRHRKTRTN